MKRLLVALILTGCPQKPVPDTIHHHTNAAPNAVVTQSAANEWTVSVTKSAGARTATGSAVLLAAPAGDETPHAEAAAAEAWLSVALTAQQDRAFNDAIDAAKKGIEDLGPDYPPKLAKEDTSIRIAMAEESIGKGDLESGAKSLIAVLDTRLKLYFIRYKDSVRRATH
jgi:hypothetical protein